MTTSQSKVEQGLLDFKLKAMSNNDFSEYAAPQEAVNYYAQAPDLKAPVQNTTTVRTSSIIPSCLDTTINNKQYVSIATTYAAGSEFYEMLAKQNAPNYTPPPVEQVLQASKPQPVFQPMSQPVSQEVYKNPSTSSVVDWDDSTPIMMRGSINY
jgi:hypothetical protein